MTAPLGKRESNKLATRRALQGAADRLFAERGFAATTVRDIAAAAGVTERTFFRYFDGKEDLVVDDVLAWLPMLADRIRSRPATETPLIAVEQVLQEAAKMFRESAGPTPMWLFTEGPRLGGWPGPGRTC